LGVDSEKSSVSVDCAGAVVVVVVVAGGFGLGFGVGTGFDDVVVTFFVVCWCFAGVTTRWGFAAAA